jgi:hypothetical protein
MANVRRRIERLERFLAPKPGPDPYGATRRLALQSLSTEDLTVLADVIEQIGGSASGRSGSRPL